jgi:hypothetical protein
MNVRRALIIVTVAAAAMPATRAGHEPPVYPSYYPHEIEITTLAPARAAELIAAGKLHAFVGAGAKPAATASKAVDSIAYLGELIVVRLNPRSPVAADEASACAAVGAVVRAMAASGDGNAAFVAHPYPVTPFHGDYLHHADLAQAAIARLARPEAATMPAGPRPKVRTEGALAQSLLPPEWRTEGADWDAAVSAVAAGDLVASSMVALNGWIGPRWARSGWFQAYRLLADFVAEPERKLAVASALARLQSGEVEGLLARVNLERDLVALLTRGCRAAVAGYTVRRGYFNADASAGIENIAYDAFEGFNAPMFLRTVKLKDFPWNGWLQLGIEAPFSAAWNPIGGFTDEFGRLVWFAVGDAAVMPSPYDHGWVLNRISEVRSVPSRCSGACP